MEQYGSIDAFDGLGSVYGFGGDTWFPKPSHIHVHTYYVGTDIGSYVLCYLTKKISKEIVLDR